MEAAGFRLRSIEFGPAGSAAVASAKLEPRPGHATWQDVQVFDREAAEVALLRDFECHEMAVEDALSTQERPNLREYPNELFLSANSVWLDEGEVRFGEVGFFVRKDRLLTVHTTPSPILDSAYERWSSGNHAKRVRPSTILHDVLDTIVDSYFPVLEVLEDQVDDLADQVFAGDTARVGLLISMKRQLLEIRQRMAPTRDVLNELLRHGGGLLDEASLPYLQDVYDHTIRVLEWLELNREMLATIMDLHLSAVSNNVNVTVRKMTVISTVLMTMALISGIYGMNFHVMPELSSPIGYPLALLGMAISGGFVAFLFWRKRWF